MKEKVNKIKEKIELYKAKETAQVKAQEVGDKLNQRIPFKPFHLMSEKEKAASLEARDLYFKDLYAERELKKQEKNSLKNK